MYEYNWAPDDEHCAVRNMYRESETNKYIKEVCQSWLLARIIPRCMVNKILKNH